MRFQGTAQRRGCWFGLLGLAPPTLRRKLASCRDVTALQLYEYATNQTPKVNCKQWLVLWRRSSQRPQQPSRLTYFGTAFRHQQAFGCHQTAKACDTSDICPHHLSPTQRRIHGLSSRWCAQSAKSSTRPPWPPLGSKRRARCTMVRVHLPRRLTRSQPRSGRQASQRYVLV